MKGGRSERMGWGYSHLAWTCLSLTRHCHLCLLPPAERLERRWVHWPWSCFCGLEDDHILATWFGETFRQMMLLLLFRFGTGMSPTDGVCHNMWICYSSMFLLGSGCFLCVLFLSGREYVNVFFDESDHCQICFFVVGISGWQSPSRRCMLFWHNVCADNAHNFQQSWKLAADRVVMLGTWCNLSNSE